MRAESADWWKDGLCYSLAQAEQLELAVKTVHIKKNDFNRTESFGLDSLEVKKSHLEIIDGSKNINSQ